MVLWLMALDYVRRNVENEPQITEPGFKVQEEVK